jgi:hypothetical protein
MATYTVHEPPLREDESATDPERFVFVRDGFYIWAFALTPLWMLRHRLWLVLLGYVLLTVAINVALALAGAAMAVAFVVGALVSLLVGFEAASLRRWTLRRRGWANVGVVVGDDVETAERRFFEAWVKSESPHAMLPARPLRAAVSVPVMQRPPAGSGVIGLFPTPGAPR